MVVLNLISEAGKVTDELAFLRLLRRMATDWKDERQKESATARSPYSAGAAGWENATIGQFLEAAAAWAEASSRTANVGSEVSDAWHRAAKV